MRRHPCRPGAALGRYSLLLDGFVLATKTKVIRFEEFPVRVPVPRGWQFTHDKALIADIVGGDPTLSKLTRAFGAILRERRTKAGLSQEALAHLAKTQQGYISLMEHGRRSPSLVTLALLAEALNVSMATLVREVGKTIQEP